MTAGSAQAPDIRPIHWLMIAALGLIWGATFLLIELALEGITPFWLAAARIGFAAILMVAVWSLRGFRLFSEPPASPGARAAALFVIGALSTAIPFMLLSWGQQHVTSGFAGVSMAAIGLNVLPLAHFLLPGERMTWRRTAGFVIGFAGVVVLIGGSAFASSGEELEFAGRAACLTAPFCYALATVLMRRMPPVDPIGLSTMLLLAGAMIVIPVALVHEGPPPLPDGTTLAVLAILGLIPTAGANLLRVMVVRSAGPVFMSLTSYQVPVWSVVFGAAILGEPLPASLLLALALILCGVGLSQYGPLRRLFSRHT